MDTALKRIVIKGLVFLVLTLSAHASTTSSIVPVLGYLLLNQDGSSPPPEGLVLPYTDAGTTVGKSNSHQVDPNECNVNTNLASHVFGGTGMYGFQSIQFEAQFTFSAWIKYFPTNLPGMYPPSALLLHRPGGGALGYAVSIDSNLRIRIAPNGVYSPAAILVGTSQLQAGTWHHVIVAMNRDTNSSWLWIDGVVDPLSSDGAAPFANTAPSSITTLGGDPHGGYSGFRGEMDDVVMLPKVINAKEVNDLYSDSNGAPMRLGPDHWYRFDHPTGGGVLLRDHGFLPVDGGIVGAVGTGSNRNSATPAIGVASPDVVYEFNSPKTGWYIAEVSDLGFKASLSLIDLLGMPLQSCLDHASQLVTPSGSPEDDTLVFFAEAGEKLHIVLDGVGSSGNYTFTFREVEHLVINEVDYDQAGSDTTEFVELYNANSFPIRIDNVALELVDGSNNTSYDTVNLSTQPWIPADSYWVYGSNTLISTLPPRIPSLAASNDFLQNGAPDGLRLVSPNASVVDGLAYEGSISGTGEGMPSGFLGVDVGAGSIGRCNGEDTNSNNIDFTLKVTPTAGEPNSGACP